MVDSPADTAPRTERSLAAALPALGLATLLAADWCANLVDGLPSGADGTAGGYAFRLALALGCLLCAVLPHPAERVLQSRRGGTVLASLLLVGQLGFVYAPLLPAPALVKTVAGVICGFATGLLLVGWLARFCTLDPKSVAVLMAASYLLVALVYFVLAALHPLAATLAVALLPFVSGALYLIGTGPDPATEKTARALHASQGWAFPIYPVVLMVAFKFAFNFSLAFSHGATMHGPLGILVVATFALVGSLFFYERFNPSALYKIALPCMVAGLLMLAWVNVGDNAATMVSNAGNIAFELFMLIALAHACRRYQASPLWVFGIVEGAAYFFSWLGKLAGGMYVAAFPAGTFGSNAAVLVLVVGLITLCSFFSGERMARRTFGDAVEVSAAGTAGNDETVSLGAAAPANGGLTGIALRCAELSRAHDLSRREEQVLELLAQGLSVAQIEEELTVSRSTVKTHIQHIYEKLCIHSRDEVHALMTGMNAGETGIGRAVTDTSRVRA